MNGLPAPTPGQIEIGDAGGPLDLGWAREARLDTQIVYALLPKATLKVFCAYDAKWVNLTSAILGAVSVDPDVISMSFGAPEYSLDAMQSNGLYAVPPVFANLNQIFADVYGQTTFVASSGDSGADKLRVQFPTSSPFVLSVGGTQLDANGNPIAWSNSGGGFSRLFELPYYQQIIYNSAPSLQQNSRITNPGLPGRMVPDLAFGAQPGPGTGMAVDVGTLYNYGNPAYLNIGGTSASAPIAAALIAASKKMRGHRAFAALHGDIYSGALSSLNSYYYLFLDVVFGNNSFYQASPGYDTVTGLGIPYFGRLARYLAGQP